MALFLFGNGVRRSLVDARLQRINSRVDKDLLQHMRTLCLSAPLPVLRHINLAALEAKWGVPREKLIPAFLQAAKAGVFDLQYVLHCDMCKAEAGVPRLSQFKHEMQCAACKSNVAPQMDQSVEAIFTIHPDLARASPDLQPGAKPYLPAIEVVNTEEFRLLFEAEKPLPGEHLLVNQLTFLFTDLSGSTATYERLGDGRAFSIVREHFTLLFDTVKKHNGGVIKTIGDAVMATFLKPEDAVACALETRQLFAEFNRRKDIKGAAMLKMGVHGGKCLAVTLNQRLDFFGATVNRASRIQGVAGKDEICLSGELGGNPSVQPLLARQKKARQRVALKGIKKPVEILCVR
ncbi:adenylate/guanylate cyclase domain-containing protein [Candidatus Woesearchaeota archaeon]|nr:adenylate/guanylate cyclase domain-containing protein [Candidatus Woesearchaeota archaeon]